MNPYKQRIAIAEACGWKRWDNPQDNHGHPYSAPIGTSPFLGRHALPSYLDDLNAMHEAEKTLTPDQIAVYDVELFTHGDTMLSRYQWHATAAQRAEAFLRVLSLWDDEK